MKNEFVNHSKHAHISAQSIDATVAFLEERRQTVALMAESRRSKISYVWRKINLNTPKEKRP
jgi:hypothetical protein